MSDEARSTPELEAAEERPSGLPDQKSAARLKTPVPDAPRPSRPDETPSEARRDTTPLRPGEPRPEESKARRDSTPLRPGETTRPSRRDPTPIRPPRKDETPLRVVRPAQERAESGTVERPPGLTQMTTSARLRLQLVLDDDERPRIDSTPPPDPKKPPSLSAAQVPPFDPRDLSAVRSLGVWIGLCGLMTLTVGALTGLSYFTGEGKVANVVVGILASALSVWLLAAAFSFSRAGHNGRVTHRLVSGFSLLRSAFLLKAILLFAAMALGCFTFSLAASLLFLL